jgi:microcystin-dependent protein
MGPSPVSGNVTIGNAGGSQPFGIVQPLQAIQFIICVQGLYPSRN